MPAKDDYLRDPNKMHRIFALSSVILTIAVICMTVADYDDEWRDYQRTFNALEAARLDREAEAITTEDYDVAIANLTAAVEEANASLATRKDELDQLDAEIVEAARVYDVANRTVKEQRALRDVARANEGLGVRDGLSAEAMHKLHDELTAKQELVDTLEIEMERARTALDDLKAKQLQITRERDMVSARLSDAQKDLEQKLKVRNRIAPTGLAWVKRKMMEWPILDGFNSHLKIDNEGVYADLPQKLGMAKSQRFDRCRTCHLGIDKVGAGNVPMFPHGHPESADYHDWIDEGKFPHPYSTHPRPDVYLTPDSPHPFNEFGCTICHEGQGSGTSFQNASHGPNDPAQEHEWKEKYGYFHNHFWEYPMLPQRFQESHCLKCHHNVVELGTNPRFGATAPKLVRGYELVKEFGCFGCHEIQGYNAAKPIGPDLRLEPQTPEEAARIAADPTLVAGEMRKVGPSLRYLASKVESGWVESWTANPSEFRPTTRMPRFFGLTNQQDHLARELQPAEITAVTHFLLNKSAEFEYLRPTAGYAPDADRGEELFSQKGCMACHTHSTFPGTTADFGPNLDRISEKLPAGEKGFLWLYSWIKEPTRYHARTKMPDLFLDPYTEQGAEIDPAADIAAWLLSKGSREWTAAELDDAALDKLVRLNMQKKVLTTDDFETFMKSRDITRGGKVSVADLKGDEIEFWREDLSDVSDDEWREMKLNYVGRRTVTRYGCYGCHDIAGFEMARPIGTTLQDWGRKERSKLAPEHIEQFFELPIHHVIAVPLAEGENAKDLLAGVKTARQFKELVKSRRADENVPVKPFETSYIAGDDHAQLGDVDSLPALEAGEWTEETVEVEKQGQTTRFLLFAEKVRSSHEDIEQSVKNAVVDNFPDQKSREDAMRTAYFYQSLTHHGRDGFLWQKLRQPRSYDYATLDSKGTVKNPTGYDDRLRMPQFPFTEDDIEAVATFVLGLVAEPPVERYQYRPNGPEGDRIAGEKLLAKFNCTGCHQVEMPRFQYQALLDDLPGPGGSEPLPENTPQEKPAEISDEIFARQTVQRQEILELLTRVKPPKVIEVAGHADRAVLDVSGQVFYFDPEAEPGEQEYSFDVWDHILIQRRPMTGRVQMVQSSSKTPLIESSLSPDGNIFARITQNAESRALTVEILRRPVVDSDDEDEEPAEPAEPVALAAETVELSLDLSGGKQKFVLVRQSENTFVLAGEMVPAEITELKKLYGTLTVDRADIRITPSRRLNITEPEIVAQIDGRGGHFTDWLVESLLDGKAKGDRNLARSMSPPPLYHEGHKVQTPWLYRFLKQPETLRHLTVLRMPKFNMSDDEARTLANYFAAIDGAEYPYQSLPEKEDPYLKMMSDVLHNELHVEGDYLGESWKVLNAPLCIGCHSVGGRAYKPSATNDPNKPEVRGPDLRRAEERLRPEWTLLWIYYPRWNTPYTSMPQNFVLEKRLYPELFNGDPAIQTRAIRDALMNHSRLLESPGILEYVPAAVPGTAPPANGETSNE